MQHGPYLIPAGAPPGSPLLMEEERPPEAVYYFRIYAALVILNLLALFGWGLYLMLDPIMRGGVSGSSATGEWVIGLVLVVVGLVPLVPHGIALFGGRRKWVYTLALVLIGINMLWVTCCLPITIPMLIYWMKPETKRWYGAT
jgi:hypothetical protein